mmetsp:Transcript_46634/g.73002  ORF Transcript_46634/g.73002 Transcript_46634/m.73002 type:complete len:312 (-) Transcript_46634:154-1089(-)
MRRLVFGVLCFAAVCSGGLATAECKGMRGGGAGTRIFNQRVADLVELHKDSLAVMRDSLQEDLSKSKVVGQPPHMDTWMIRFLAESKFDPGAAAESYRQMLFFRERNGLDEIRRKFENGMHPRQVPGSELFHSFAKGTFHFEHGTAKDGSPLNIQQVLKWDYDGLSKNMPAEMRDLYQLHAREFQMFVLDRIAEDTGLLKGYLKIIDLDGLTFANFHYGGGAEERKEKEKERLGMKLNDAFPQMTSTFRVVNAPRVMSFFWKVASLFLSRSESDKMCLSGRRGTPGDLRTLVDEETLPQYYGGKNKKPFLL